jgi:putative acetyltransferase
MTIIITKEREPDSKVLSLIKESDEFYARLYPEESNHLLSWNDLTGDGIEFFVARRDNDVCGFGGIVIYDDYCEVKRMYVSNSFRGHGLGRTMLDTLEDEARNLKINRICLETGIHQPEAISLYKKNGYIEIGPFGNYKADPLSIFMEKRV